MLKFQNSFLILICMFAFNLVPHLAFSKGLESKGLIFVHLRKDGMGDFVHGLNFLRMTERAGLKADLAVYTYGSELWRKRLRKVAGIDFIDCNLTNELAKNYAWILSVSDQGFSSRFEQNEKVPYADKLIRITEYDYRMGSNAVHQQLKVFKMGFGPNTLGVYLPEIPNNTPTIRVSNQDLNPGEYGFVYHGHDRKKTANYIRQHHHKFPHIKTYVIPGFAAPEMYNDFIMPVIECLKDLPEITVLTDDLSLDQSRTLLYFSHTLVAVTGDNTFVEALWFGKIPNYDKRPYKIPMYNSFLKLYQKYSQDSGNNDKSEVALEQYKIDTQRKALKSKDLEANFRQQILPILLDLSKHSNL